VSILGITLAQVLGALNAYCHTAVLAPEDWVVLSNVVEQDGSPVESAVNKVAMLVTSIQHDTTIGTWNPASALNSTTFGIMPPPLYLNLYVLFYANFSGLRYMQGIEMISLVLQYFQANPCFTHDNLPDLPTTVEKLAFEIANLDPMALNYIMSTTGVKYLPSAYYRVRMIPLTSVTLQQQVPVAQGYQLGPNIADGELPTVEPQPLASTGKVKGTNAAPAGKDAGQNAVKGGSR
jgi:Pvc16 N-terminal domain